MANLDLVVSVDSAIAHLAGALAVPVWTAIRAESEWRWLQNREDSPWYPTMRLFRQAKTGDWSGVIARMADELGNLVAARPRSPAPLPVPRAPIARAPLGGPGRMRHTSRRTG